MTPKTYFFRWVILGLLFVSPIYILLFLILRRLGG